MGKNIEIKLKIESLGKNFEKKTDAECVSLLCKAEKKNGFASIEPLIEEYILLTAKYGADFFDRNPNIKRAELLDRYADCELTL